MLALILLLFTSCTLFPVRGGGVSNDVAESKKREVFVAEYKVSRNPCIINDSIRIHVKEAWIETHWHHSKDNYWDTYEREGYQLCINTEETDIKGLTFEWHMGCDKKQSMRTSSKNSIMADFAVKPTGDTIMFPVWVGDDYDTVQPIVGEFVLVKKH